MGVSSVHPTSASPEKSGWKTPSSALSQTTSGHAENSGEGAFLGAVGSGTSVCISPLQ